MPEIVISDTSCLIVLSKIRELDLCVNATLVFLSHRKWNRNSEILYRNGFSFWNLPAPLGHKVANLNIDLGEKAAIALALDVPGSLLILDDEKARHAAERFHLTITGTLGILVKAKKAGLLQSIKPLIDKIMETDFRLSSTIVQQALAEAGEV